MRIRFLDRCLYCSLVGRKKKVRLWVDLERVSPYILIMSNAVDTKTLNSLFGNPSKMKAPKKPLETRDLKQRKLSTRWH